MTKKSSINVLGVNVRVKRIKTWKGHKDVPTGLVGRYYPDTQTIYICTSHSKDVQKQFLLHEINHVIMYITGIDQNISLDLQEVIAQSFASFYKGLT